MVLAFVSFSLSHLFFPFRKKLNRDYEMSVLEEGDFDERVFLHPNANEEIGTPLAVGSHNFQNSLAAHTPPQHVQYGTPLLGRELLGTRDHKLTPASEATHSVSQLHVLLEGCRPDPSDYVRKLCDSCMANPLPHLICTIKELGEKLVEKSPSVSVSLLSLSSPETLGWFTLSTLWVMQHLTWHQNCLV